MTHPDPASTHRGSSSPRPTRQTAPPVLDQVEGVVPPLARPVARRPDLRPGEPVEGRVADVEREEVVQLSRRSAGAGANRRTDGSLAIAAAEDVYFGPVQ
jgi:hypothetical protein